MRLNHSAWGSDHPSTINMAIVSVRKIRKKVLPATICSTCKIQLEQKFFGLPQRLARAGVRGARSPKEDGTGVRAARSPKEDGAGVRGPRSPKEDGAGVRGPRTPKRMGQGFKVRGALKRMGQGPGVVVQVAPKRMEPQPDFPAVLFNL